MTEYRTSPADAKVLTMATLTIAELKAKANEALRTDGFTDLEVRRVGKDGSLYVGRGHAAEEAIIIFLRGGKK